uniref:Uncharacterized protein n=1 Tax=Acrobeloides nanus TaxID=290746 RepID=A0A914D0G0_9BILA
MFIFWFNNENNVFIMLFEATSTYSDRWNTGCEEKSSEQSKKCANLLLNSLILRTENGTAVGSTNSKNNGKK